MSCISYARQTCTQGRAGSWQGHGPEFRVILLGIFLASLLFHAPACPCLALLFPTWDVDRNCRQSLAEKAGRELLQRLNLDFLLVSAFWCSPHPNPTHCFGLTYHQQDDSSIGNNTQQALLL